MGIAKLSPVPGGRTALTTFSEAVVQQAGVVGAVNLDLAQANDFVVIAGAGDVAIGFTNPPPAGVVVPVRLRFVQDAGGGRAFTFPGSVIWPLGVAPQWPTAPGAAATVQLVTFDGGATYVGTVLNMDGGGHLLPLAGLFGAGATYAPAWTADAHNPLVGNGSLVGRHIDIGKLCVCTVELTLGSTSIVRNDAGIWRISLPHVVSASWPDSQGVARFIRASGASPNIIPGTASLSASGAAAGFNLESATIVGDMNTLVDNTAGGIVVANGDRLTFTVAYEAA